MGANEGLTTQRSVRKARVVKGGPQAFRRLSPSRGQRGDGDLNEERSMGGRDEPICDECDGTGEIVTRKGVEVTCPVCRGTGVAR